MMVTEIFAKIISGGQTGADIAGVRGAKLLSIPTGGSMPKGWETLDGPHPEYAELYGMTEHEKYGYPPRTAQNVKDSDLTIRIAVNLCSAGEVCTLNACKKFHKENLDFHLSKPLAMPHRDKIALEAHKLLCYRERLERPLIINIAGNSEKTARGIELLAEVLVVNLLETCKTLWDVR